MPNHKPEDYPKSFWEERYNHKLSIEKEKQIKQNLFDFFNLLNEWSIRQNGK